MPPLPCPALRFRPLGLVAGLLLAAGAGAQDVPDAAPVVRPGAPGQAGSLLADGGPDHASLPHTAADVHFMQGMIGHHLQAVAMAELVEGRTDRREILLLSERILRSQEDEIALMQGWLLDRDEAVPEGAPHHAMHGMLSEAQMGFLAEARGPDFDRLFLAGMIQHHEGALAMVAELFASPGAAQEEEIFTFASHVESDQTVEIARMEALLRTLLPGGSPAGSAG